jgi:hypothetical protein
MNSKRRVNLARAATITAALAFIVIGILRKEHLIVLEKAVAICLECIGVG